MALQFPTTYRFHFALFAVIALAQAIAPSSLSANSPPNVIVFLTDDESWSERSIYGRSNLPTPHFDAAARCGVLFRHAYSSAPSCAPARASLLTGRNFWELEQGAFIQAWLPKKFPIVTDLLQQGNYEIANTGKGWGPGIFNEQSHAPNMLGKTYRKPIDGPPIPGISRIDYVASFQQFLDERSGNSPYFFWMGVLEPHDPFGAGNHKRLTEEFGVSIDEVLVPGQLPDTRKTRESRGDFLYEICYADQQLGKLISLLKSRGEWENTLLVITADNGTAGFRSKASPYDQGVHVPLAIVWPGAIPGERVIEDFVNFRDIAPTLLEAAGQPIPDAMSGESLLPTLSSNKQGHVELARDSMVTGLEWHGELSPVNLASRSVRNRRYAYVRNYGNVPGREMPNYNRLLTADRPSEELYDLELDPWQINNRIEDPKLADVLRGLRNELETYQRKTSDPRITGEMKLFEETRRFVEARKSAGYKD